MRKLNEDIKRIKSLMSIIENDDLEDYFTQDYTGQEGPHDENNMAPDGMDDDSDTTDGEISEEGETTTTSSSGGASAGYPTVTKWESGATRGKGNPIDSKKKWESGLTRGKGNTLI